MKYTINNKTYTEFDINKRCAEIMRLQVLDSATLAATRHKSYRNITLNSCWVMPTNSNYSTPPVKYSPCNTPSDTDAIINKCWVDLMERDNWCGRNQIEWQYQMKKHNCTKLVAACICLIECNGGEL